MFGLISAGADLLSGVLNNEAAQDRQDAANAFSAQQYATRYQTTVKDMEAAGLNPALAYGGISGSSPSGSIASSSGFPAIGSSFAQGELAESRSRESVASAGELEARTRLQDETVDRVKQDVKNLVTDRDRNLAVIENLRVEYQNLVKQGYNLTEVGNQLRSTVDKIRAEIPNIEADTVHIYVKRALDEIRQGGESSRNALLAQDVRAGAAFGEVGKTVGQLEPFLRLLWSAFRR